MYKKSANFESNLVSCDVVISTPIKEKCCDQFALLFWHFLSYPWGTAIRYHFPKNLFSALEYLGNGKRFSFFPSVGSA